MSHEADLEDITQHVHRAYVKAKALQLETLQYILGMAALELADITSGGKLIRSHTRRRGRPATTERRHRPGGRPPTPGTNR